MPAGAGVPPTTSRPLPTPPACCRVARAAGESHCAALFRSSDGNAEYADARLALAVERLRPEVLVLMRRAAARGLDPEDLTQAYFARFVEKGTLRQLEAWHGCVRPFLATSVRYFAANARDHARAVKRGGRLRHVPIERALESTRAGGIDAPTPEALLLRDERRNAVARAVSALRARASDDSQRARLERLLEVIVAERDPRELARAWGVRPVAVRVAAHRLRRRLARELSAR